VQRVAIRGDDGSSAASEVHDVGNSSTQALQDFGMRVPEAIYGAGAHDRKRRGHRAQQRVAA
jgi:hypothetical protein